MPGSKAGDAGGNCGRPVNEPLADAHAAETGGARAAVNGPPQKTEVLPFDDPFIRDKNGRVVGERPTAKSVMRDWFHCEPPPGAGPGNGASAGEKDFALANEDVRLNPRSADAHLGRGIVYEVRFGKLDEAMADFEQAVRLDPKQAVAYLRRGDIWFSRKDYDKAMSDFTQAIKLEPGNALGFFARAMAYQAVGNWDRAVADWTELLKLRPDGATEDVTSAAARVMTSDDDGAIRIYRRR